MNIVMWVLFAIELLVRYGPSFVNAIIKIIQDIDAKKNATGEPLPAEQKRLEFEPLAIQAFVQKKGAMPDQVAIVKIREWALQKERGRQWKAAPMLAQATGLDKFYA